MFFFFILLSIFNFKVHDSTHHHFSQQHPYKTHPMQRTVLSCSPIIILKHISIYYELYFELFKRVPNHVNLFSLACKCHLLIIRLNSKLSLSIISTCNTTRSLTASVRVFLPIHRTRRWRTP